MPSSFTRVLPNAFGCSPSTPVSDCGTGRTMVVTSGAFRGRVKRGFRIECRRPCGTGASITPTPHLPASSAGSTFIGSRNINRLPIGYALGPRLRSRLTLGGLTFPRKPCAFGGRASHPSCRYSFRHTHSPTLQWSSSVHLQRCWRRSPTTRFLESATAARRLSPRHFRRGMARPVSCYALLKWWLLLSQHPGCHGDPTSFATERRFGGLGRRSGLFPSRAREAYPPRSDSRGPAAVFGVGFRRVGGKPPGRIPSLYPRMTISRGWP